MADNEEVTELEDEVDRGDNFVPDEEEIDEEVLEDEEDTSEEEVDEDEEEPEEDEEESESEGDEDEDEEEDEDDEEEARIPRSRLNQVIEQREAERERAEWLEEQLATMIELQKQNIQNQAPKEEPKPKFNFKAKFKEANEALLEGELDKNAEIMLEIEEARQAEITEALRGAKESATQEAKSEATASLEDARFERIIDKATEDFEFLDADSDNYDESAVKLVNSVMAGKVAQGTAKSKALKEALSEVTPMFVDQEPAKPKETLGKKRTKAARKKAAKASQQQPPDTPRAAKGKAARELDKVDVAKMSEKEYNKLTLRERKELRGD